MIDRPDTPHADVLLEGIWEDEVTPDDLASRALSAAQASSYAFRVASEGTTATAQLSEVEAAEFIESETGKWARSFIGIVRVGESLVHVSHALGELARSLQQVNLEQSEIVYQVEAEIAVAERQSAQAGVDPTARVAELIAAARARAAEVAENMVTPEVAESRKKPVGLVSGFMAFGRVPGASAEAGERNSRVARNGHARNGYGIRTNRDERSGYGPVNGRTTNGRGVENDHPAASDADEVSVHHGTNVDEQRNGTAVVDELPGSSVPEVVGPIATSAASAAAAALDAFADSVDETPMNPEFIGFGRTPGSAVPRPADESVPEESEQPVPPAAPEASATPVSSAAPEDRARTVPAPAPAPAPAPGDRARTVPPAAPEDSAMPVDAQVLPPGLFGLGRVPSPHGLAGVVATTPAPRPITHGAAIGVVPADGAPHPSAVPSGPIPVLSATGFLPIPSTPPVDVSSAVAEESESTEVGAETADSGFLAFGRVPGTGARPPTVVVPTVTDPIDPIDPPDQEADEPEADDPEAVEPETVEPEEAEKPVAEELAVDEAELDEPDLEMSEADESESDEPEADDREDAVDDAEDDAMTDGEPDPVASDDDLVAEASDEETVDEPDEAEPADTGIDTDETESEVDDESRVDGDADAGTAESGADDAVAESSELQDTDSEAEAEESEAEAEESAELDEAESASAEPDSPETEMLEPEAEESEPSAAPVEPAPAPTPSGVVKFSDLLRSGRLNRTTPAATSVPLRSDAPSVPDVEPSEPVATPEPAVTPAPAPTLATGPVILGRKEPLVLPASSPEVGLVREVIGSILGSLRKGPHGPESGLHWAAALMEKDSESVLAVTTSDAGWLPIGVLIPAGVRVLWNVPGAYPWASIDDPVRQLVDYAERTGFALKAVATTHQSRVYSSVVGEENMVLVRRAGPVLAGGRSRLEATVSPARMHHIRSLNAEQARRQMRAFVMDLESRPIAPEHAIGIEAARLDARCFLEEETAVPRAVLRQLHADEQALGDALVLDRKAPSLTDLTDPAPVAARLRDRLLERAIVVATLASAYRDLHSAAYAWTFARFLSSQEQDSSQ